MRTVCGRIIPADGIYVDDEHLPVVKELARSGEEAVGKGKTQTSNKDHLIAAKEQPRREPSDKRTTGRILNTSQPKKNGDARNSRKNHRHIPTTTNSSGAMRSSQEHPIITRVVHGRIELVLT
jgi:hypothetical protein